MFGKLMRWSPGEELSNWLDIDDLCCPRVETYRKDNDYYVVRVDLPGVDPKDVHVEAEGNLLSITGERKAEEKGPEYRETFDGKFERRFTLPQGVDAGKISAHYEHGFLNSGCRYRRSSLDGKFRFRLSKKEEKRKLESKVA